jgi:serine/threonine protein kinase
VVSPRLEWWAKIAGFDIAKRIEDATTLRTMHIGTSGYMVPEVMGMYHPDDDVDEDGDEEAVMYD